METELLNHMKFVTMETIIIMMAVHLAVLMDLLHVICHRLNQQFVMEVIIVETE